MGGDGGKGGAIEGMGAVNLYITKHTFMLAFGIGSF